VIDHVGALRTESERFSAAVARAADDGVRVPSCPAWTVRDLVAHLGRVQRFWAAMVRRGGTEPPTERPDLPSPGAGDDLAAWYRACADDLLEAVTSTSSDREAWAWWESPHTVAAITRHQVQEAGVHRWDLEAALGRPEPLDADVAADAVDEFLEIVVPARQGEQPWSRPTGVLELAATDVEGVRHLSLTGDGPRRSDEPEAIPLTTITAPATDLLLVLYRRVPLDAVDVRGDQALAAALVDWLVVE